MRQFFDKHENNLLREVLENKIVLVGANLDGIPDVIESPVHGSIAGVFYHAMALDNLMTYGKNYWREPSGIEGVISWVDLMQALYIIIVLSIRNFWFVSKIEKENSVRKRLIYWVTFAAIVSFIYIIVMLCIVYFTRWVPLSWNAMMWVSFAVLLPTKEGIFKFTGGVRRLFVKLIKR